MASASSSLVSGALRSLLLCVLMLLPTLMSTPQGLVGGWRDRQVTHPDPDVKNAADVAIDHYNRGSNSVFYSRALELQQARSQVVEGMNYYLKILLVNTKCDKRSSQGLAHVDLGQCSLPPRKEQQRQLCKFYVWSRPWLNDTHVTHMSCGHVST